ncbi:HAD family hydrolase [Candidatus Gracilibacteria bacterium]|nr:HAD family hydrolase [Candidatus Gracilibacteria bacterium]MCF7856277.1 HAD family hydrolase [Candidatus Gracilibacteria bacterium]MCF7896244.1 HAD family hydrolase [Candidatus Gracilibacteria bacterium]
MKLKAILFDFDGTLVYSIDMLVEIFGELLAERNLPKVDPAKIRKLIGEPLPEIFRKIAPISDADFLEKRFREIEFERNNADEIELVTETVSTLEFLKSHNLRIGIVSTKRVAVVEKLARELGIWDFFEIVVGRDLITKPKPDPEPILFGCRKLGIKPQEILFVGDSLLDLKSAKAAGATFFGVLTGVCDRAEFKKNRADYIFSHIGELVNLIRELQN